MMLPKHVPRHIGFMLRVTVDDHKLMSLVQQDNAVTVDIVMGNGIVCYKYSVIGRSDDLVKVIMFVHYSKCED